KIEQWKGSEVQRRLLARLPQLVSQDGKAQAIYPRVVIPDYFPSVGFNLDMRKPIPVEGLAFVGKLSGKAGGKFRLLYPVDETMPAPPMYPAKKDASREESFHTPNWAEIPLDLDFTTTVEVPAPQFNGKRKPQQAPARDDLEGLWAAAQAQRLAVLEALT